MKDKKKLAREIATWVVTAVMMSVFILDIICVALCNKYADQNPVITESEYKKDENDRIHFLNTANSDCILIESNGHFALIDSGEGDRNPRRKTAYKGYEKEVLSFIKKRAIDKNGNVKLDFILATHYHYDHDGNFETIISDKDIQIGKAYMKPYSPETATSTERTAWGNEKTYEAIISALKKRRIPIESELPAEEFTFGDFTLKFLNTRTPEELAGKGENANSVGVIVKKGKKAAFLAADITSKTGLEKIYASEIGDIDILKIGHHGYFGSSSASFLKVLKPEIAICTNYLGKIYPNVKWNLTMTSHAAIYSTENRNGISTVFTDSGAIDLVADIM